MANYPSPICRKTLVPDEDSIVEKYIGSSFESKITKKTVTFENMTREFANDICGVCPVQFFP